MRIREIVLATLGLVSASFAYSTEASAQTTGVPAIAPRDETWGTVSHAMLGVGAGTVFLMPRVYYSDPEATVGWKGRWHFSMFAPAMTMAAATFLVDGPIRNALQYPRPGCSVDQTLVANTDSGCETFGGPSTHAFASWGATGVGTGIFLVDTIKYSKGRFNAGSFIGNIGVPLVASILTSVGRGVESPAVDEFGTQTLPYETSNQIIAGTFAGFFTGLLVGGAYALLQRPSCGYGNAIFCW
ncbi:hypothetical protein [Polyangium jinanense]|uniref:Uncharacterized protein n=1 Tax=Polyangium jinanense TaxID=2829994 RepID=A0A9X4AVC7_9BACT|nr:hypothetical protein [Polyangium jinanense]MDC3956520.1 hypothetical protein [Polyangium jinanense]MDC3985551.1 hypothetical protein [Polyangium jinanense]